MTDISTQNKYFRAEKSNNRNSDDFKVLIVGLTIGVMILLLSLVTPRLVEFRWYRDFAQLTPFSDVQLMYSEVIDNNTKIIIGGSMIKNRCDFNFEVANPVSYVTDQFDQRHRIIVDTSPEDKITGIIGNSRPPSEFSEIWGPWIIDITNREIFGSPLIPTQFEIQVYHVNCPTEPVDQVNLFVKGVWGDFRKDPNTPVIVPTEGENE